MDVAERIRAFDEWEGGFIGVTDVQSVEARGGTVVAGGEMLYLLKAGHQGWWKIPPPEEVGPVRLVAVEPRGVRRHAVASDEMLAIVCGTHDDAPVVGVHPRMPLRQLAWGGTKGECALYFMLDDGSLARMTPDLKTPRRLNVEAIAALASDDSGVLAMAALDGETPCVYVTRDGAEMKFRSIDHPIDRDASVQIAVADAAVALVVDGRYVLLSRGHLDSFKRVEVLDSPEGSGWTTGPVAFQGASSDAALFCARSEGTWSKVLRVDPSGASMSAFGISTADGDPAPPILSLSWDASRRTLWGVVVEGGIFLSRPPGAKGKKLS